MLAARQMPAELIPAVAAMVEAARAEARAQAADELAAEARLLSSGPGDGIRRKTLNVAAKNLRRPIRAYLEVRPSRWEHS